MSVKMFLSVLWGYNHRPRYVQKWQKKGDPTRVIQNRLFIPFVKGKVAGIGNGPEEALLGISIPLRENVPPVVVAAEFISRQLREGKNIIKSLQWRTIRPHEVQKASLITFHVGEGEETLKELANAIVQRTVNAPANFTPEQSLVPYLLDGDKDKFLEVTGLKDAVERRLQELQGKFGGLSTPGDIPRPAPVPEPQPAPEPAPEPVPEPVSETKDQPARPEAVVRVPKRLVRQRLGEDEGQTTMMPNWLVTPLAVALAFLPRWYFAPAVLVLSATGYGWPILLTAAGVTVSILCYERWWEGYALGIIATIAGLVLTYRTHPKMHFDLDDFFRNIGRAIVMLYHLLKKPAPRPGKAEESSGVTFNMGMVTDFGLLVSLGLMVYPPTAKVGAGLFLGFLAWEGQLRYWLPLLFIAGVAIEQFRPAFWVIARLLQGLGAIPPWFGEPIPELLKTIRTEGLSPTVSVPVLVDESNHLKIDLIQEDLEVRYQHILDASLPNSPDIAKARMMLAARLLKAKEAGLVGIQQVGSTLARTYYKVVVPEEYIQLGGDPKVIETIVMTSGVSGPLQLDNTRRLLYVSNVCPVSASHPANTDFEPFEKDGTFYLPLGISSFVTPPDSHYGLYVTFNPQWASHLLIMAGTGAGKTALIARLVEMARKIQGEGLPKLVFLYAEGKQDLAAPFDVRVAHKHLLMHPFVVERAADSVNLYVALYAISKQRELAAKKVKDLLPQLVQQPNLVRQLWPEFEDYWRRGISYETLAEAFQIGETSAVILKRFLGYMPYTIMIVDEFLTMMAGAQTLMPFEVTIDGVKHKVQATKILQTALMRVIVTARSQGIAIVLATQSARAHATPDIVRDNAAPILGEVGGMNQQVVGAVLGSALQFFKETFEREGQNWISSINRYCWVCKLTGGIKHVRDGKEVPAIQTVMGSSVRVEGDIFYPPYVSKSSILNPSGPWPELPELVKKRLNLLGVNPYTLGILPWPDYTSFIEATKWALTEVIREAVVQA